jgi:hypothetical protein
MRKEKDVESLLLKGLRALSGLTFEDLAAEFNLSIQMIRLVILDPARFPVLAPKVKKRLVEGAAKNGFVVSKKKGVPVD